MAQVMTASPSKLMTKGFTLVELLVVIAIIAVLALVSFTGARRLIESGKKVQALAQFRNMGTGLSSFESDYNRPPIPSTMRPKGQDALYGDSPNPKYHNGFIVAVLKGDITVADFSYPGGTLSVRDVNPRGESYVTMPSVATNKAGVGLDGNLYDPWGKEIMIGINAMKGTDDTAVLVDTFPKGVSDRHLDTFGFADYTDTAPKQQSFVLFTYGLDGKKGKVSGGKTYYTGSDDVISW